ncbi:hypothetical protein RA180_18965 [Aeromonas salmonicida]|uniref:hypothetical protein n=1 Tax=Aeromonas salmonicida TaxID=645 RepID=UPI002796B665|nr:hypothetical protein [Aeromonas salmonicida]MDQ1886079.1 hypothetical protein [Aeromonas salmonicida]
MVEYVKLGRWLRITIASISLAISQAYSKDGHISLIDYQNIEQLLSVNIVAPTEGQDKLYLSAGGVLSELRRFTRVGEHKLVIYLPCSEFNSGDYLLYKVGNVTLTLPLEPISCTADSTQRQQPRIIYGNAGCIVEPKGTTLWRVGSLLAEKNGYSVYQNMYAVFLSNRHHFVDEDITRMQDNLLLCPPEEMIASIDKQHAVEMFQEAEAFRLASNMQKAVPMRNDEESVPDESWESEQLVQVIVPSEAVPSEEVAEQEADADRFAMSSTVMDARDKGLAADVNANEKAQGGEQLVQVIAPSEAVPSEEVAEQEADADRLAMSSANMGAGDKGAEGKHPIADTSLATISGDATDTAPKLVIAIDGGMHPQILPGCYIDPKNKTLWRVGVALNKLNGHSVYQNMYAVFAVNPKAFPSGDVSHMLNQKLRCPTASEVTSRTIKESKNLLGLDP